MNFRFLIKEAFMLYHLNYETYLLFVLNLKARQCMSHLPVPPDNHPNLMNHKNSSN